MNKKRLSTFGLLLITFWSAMQYIFLQNIPDSVSTFSVLCITNLVGLVILGVTQFRKLRSIHKETLFKGSILALELCGFSFFLLPGSRNMDSVVISSVVSMYFVFVTPLLLLLRKKVSFRSVVAASIAIIALILMFGGDTGGLFASKNVVYLLIADFFFASYVVSVSLLGESENSVLLTISQMTFSVIFSFIGWVIESCIGRGQMALPTDYNFWISVLFIGIFIRALYTLIQISAQKNVAPINASLIFASEIIITLITNPFLCRLFHMEYTPATGYQIIGCVLFVIAMLVVDDTFMNKFGYTDMENISYINEKGEVVNRSSVSRKLVNMTLLICMGALAVSTVVCLTSIQKIRKTTVEDSVNLGQDAAETSETALIEELEAELNQAARDKAKLAEAKLSAYMSSVGYAASYAETLLANPENYGDRESMYPLAENGGKWTMQRCLANESITYEEVRTENALFGNMEDVFAPIIENNENISTIYIGMEDGLLISYDPNSDSADNGGETYYEFRDSEWYLLGKETEGYAFTETYQDSYGRGLTITCVAPFYDAEGKFAGCVAMDILMNDLNNSMVNDGIVEPSRATLIDEDGIIIASGDLDPNAEEQISIYDENYDSPLKEVADEVLSTKEGITSTGNGSDAVYIAYSTISDTDWTLCIASPVYMIIKPAITIRDSIDQNTERVAESVSDGVRTVVENCLVLIAVIIMVVTVSCGKLAKRISDPLQKLEQDVQEISQGHFDQRTDVDTDDEIGNLAHSFNYMTESLQHYIADLKEATAKEERIASELSVATDIQASMLPNVFPAFPDHKEFDIYATMTPAKEVGGDFYDFFLIDENHLALVMADVSGKGVPAALFMVIAKTLIKNRAQTGGSPAEILGYVNDQLCEGNDAELFVTVWLGILDLTTGKGVAANAGHEHPVIKRKDGDYELIVYKHSPAVAVMEGMHFREHEFELHPGDILYVYTDGVPEATNADNELFGTDRMLDALNRNKNVQLEELLGEVKKSIDAFVGAAPQFDDITMLGFTFWGKAEKDE